ncbi:MAG TPA: hypothetical protein VKS78_16320 [Roseiarcus sp.]|nr:hypothetical protein [Roseiarcus sp.]
MTLMFAPSHGLNDLDGVSDSDNGLASKSEFVQGARPEGKQQAESRIFDDNQRGVAIFRNDDSFDSFYASARRRRIEPALGGTREAAPVAMYARENLVMQRDNPTGLPKTRFIVKGRRQEISRQGRAEQANDAR